MTVTVANTLINNTWGFWRLRTNQMADVITRQAVTVGGNAAIGTAVIDGTLQVTNTYIKNITGGTIDFPGDLSILSTTRFSVDAFVARNFSANTGTFNLVTVNGDVVATRVLVGNTVINGANVYATDYFGRWSGNTIAIGKGGTGNTTAPGNGQILVGNAGNYTLNTLQPTSGVTITNGAGTITIGNSGVLQFRANTASPFRNGNITLDSSDIINALGYFPAVANTDSWIRSGADLNYMSGNVAIGYADAGARSNGALQVRTTVSNCLSVLRVENALNTTMGNAFIMTQTANNGATQGLRFMGVGGIVPAGIDFNGGQMGTILVHTNGAYRFAFDPLGNFGVGVAVPSPNKGGNGIHISGPNPGVTLDNQLGNKWHLGMQPNMTSFGGGVRRGQGTFGLFSDEANQGIMFDGTQATGTMYFYTNGAPRLKIQPNGQISINGDPGGESAMLSVTGDINSTGSFTNFSDYRLKHDVTTLPDNAMERVMALNPVSFRWNKTDALEEGFLAHELQTVIPTAVQGVKDGVVNQVVDKAQLHPVIVKALQELINKVKEQQEQIDALTSR